MSALTCEGTGVPCSGPVLSRLVPFADEYAPLCEGCWRVCVAMLQSELGVDAADRVTPEAMALAGVTL